MAVASRNLSTHRIVAGDDLTSGRVGHILHSVPYLLYLRIRLGTLFVEHPVNILHAYRALANSTRHTFDTPRANVTGGEHARQTRFEGVRGTIGSPCQTVLRIAPVNCPTGTDEAFSIKLHTVPQPLGIRNRTNQQKDVPDRLRDSLRTYLPLCALKPRVSMEPSQ